MFAVLQVLYHLTLSDVDPFWCDGLQTRAISSVNGRNISMRFSLKDALVSTQSLAWTKNGTWMRECNRSLECISSDTLFNPDRYTLTQLSSDTEFELGIAFVEENDSGTHIVKITEGARFICTVLILNLTIEVIPPTCSTILERGRGKLQMSCQWLQVNVGDQAQLMVGNQVLYEYSAPEMNIASYFTLTNKFSVYVDPEFIFDERIMPAKCLVTHTRQRRNKTCSFPPVKQHTIRDDVLQIQYVTFNCCALNENFSLTWWYNNSCDLQPVNYTEPYTMTADRFGNIVFLCGEEDDSSNIIVHSIGQLNLPDHQYRVSFLSVNDSDLKQPNDSTDELRCETLIVNITKTEPTSPPDDSVTQENDPSSNCVVNEETNATDVVSQIKTISMEAMLLTVLALSTIAHCVSIIAFVFSYRNADEYDVRKRD